MPTNFDDPHTCPWCGQTEPNAFLLQNNHWVRPEGSTGYDWCAEHGMCIAMDLTRNHCTYYVRMLREPTYQRDHCPCYQHRRWNADCARTLLRRCLDRAREVWPADRLDWITEYETLAAAPPAPEHQAVRAGEQLDMLGVQ